MIVLKEMLEDISNDQVIDICCGVDENDTLRTPKTVFYGKAIDAYAHRKELEKVWVKKVIDIQSYVDNLRPVDGKGETNNISVIMIVLRES